MHILLKLAQATNRILDVLPSMEGEDLSHHVRKACEADLNLLYEVSPEGFRQHLAQLVTEYVAFIKQARAVGYPLMVTHRDGLRAARLEREELLAELVQDRI